MTESGPSSGSPLSLGGNPVIIFPGCKGKQSVQELCSMRARKVSRILDIERATVLATQKVQYAEHFGRPYAT
jgi:hypothetical protein